MLNLGQNLTHNRRIFLRLSKAHLSNSFRLFMAKFSATPHFPSNLMPDSLDKFYFSSSLLPTFCSFPCEIIQSTGLHDATPSFVIQVGSMYSRTISISCASNHTTPVNSQPRKVFCQLYIHLEELSKCIFQSNHDQTSIFLVLGTTQCQEFSISLSFRHFGPVQSPAPRCFWLPWVADAACCCMLKDRGTKKDSLPFLA